MRALVAGWFSLAGGGATAGDLSACGVVRDWLRAAGVDHDVALAAAYADGVDWFRVAPERYSHLVFVCGPVGPQLAVAPVVERFAGCRRIAVGVSVDGDRAWRPFDVVLARDGDGEPRPDLAFARSAGAVPVVARVRIHRQSEYPAADPDAAHSALDRLLARTPAAVLDVDTNLDPSIPGRRSEAEVDALIGRADVVLTTRLHGLVLALRHGIPALAIDPVPGGAKIAAQARAVGWPAVLVVDALDDAVLAERFTWCCGEAGRDAARRQATAARAALEPVRDELLRALAR